MQKKISIVWTIGLLSGIAMTCPAQGVRMTDWKVLSEENKTVALTDTVFLEKPCIKLDGKIKAAIWDANASYQNFRIDLDIAGAVMSGIGFHVTDEQNYQFIYFRPGYGGTEEAVQYIPIYNGALSWVMYGKYQSNADIKKLQWFHATIEVRGSNLKVFTNYNKKPEMDIMMLNSSANSGGLMLRTMFGSSYFANLNIRALPDYITNWEISEQLPPNLPLDYDQVKKVKKWTRIEETGDSYVNFCRYIPDPNGILVAKHTLVSETGGISMMNFDFAGKLHIFLNGQEVFAYDKYKLDRLDENAQRIQLNLKKGGNELVLISEGDHYFFGQGYNSLGRLQHQNWGFIAGIMK